MKRFRIRTKIEIFVAIIFVISLMAVTVTSITRTISDSQDDIITFIRSSDGYYWETNQANLQTAINSLDDEPGTIWLGSDVTLTNSIYIGENCVLDLQGHKVTVVSGSFDVFVLTGGSELCNGVIDISGASSFSDGHAAVLLDGNTQIHPKITYPGDRLTSVHDLSVYSSGERGIGIHLKADSNTVNAFIQQATVDSILTHECEVGIKLTCGGDGAPDNFVNGNIISNIQSNCDNYALYLDRDCHNRGINNVQSGTEGNIFTNIMVQPDTDSNMGAWIEGYDNKVDIVCWDYSRFDSGKTVTLNSDTDDTYLTIYGGSYNSINDLTKSIDARRNNIFIYGNSQLYLGTSLTLNPISSMDSSLTEGCLYVDSDTHHIYCYLNGAWKQLD